MAILNNRETNFIKLKSLKKENLQSFCSNFSIPASKSASITEMIKNILVAVDDGRISTEQINTYIKALYLEIRKKETAERGATHESIVEELQKVDSHVWGMVQGKADAYIQSNYVRKYFKFDDLVSALKDSLYNKMESYALCTWYNHWSTVFLEDLICLNDNVVPIIKKVKGVDVIWNEQPVDIKVTNLPKEWFRDKHTIEDAVSNPVLACEYMYTFQGAERFGSENRFFIITHNKSNPQDSWKIKRNYSLIKASIESFFSRDTQLDPVNFSFNKQQHLAHAKMMFIIE
jgi:hypothetical protein